MSRVISIRDLDIVTIYDPARSRESEYRSLARHAIGTFGMDSDYNVYVLDMWAARVPLDDILIEIERQCDVWSPRCIGVESVAAQAAIADIVYTWISMKHQIAPLYADLMPDTRVQKRWRIRMQLQRVAPFGKLFIQENQYNLKQELLAFPNGRTIDCCDILAYGIQLLNPPMAHSLSSAEDFARRKRELVGARKVEYESDDALSPLSRVPKVRKPPAEGSFVLRRAG